MSTRTWCPFEEGGVTMVAQGDARPASADIAKVETKAAGTAVPSVLSSGWTTSFGSGRLHPTANAMPNNSHFRDMRQEQATRIPARPTCLRRLGFFPPAGNAPDATSASGYENTHPATAGLEPS